MLQSTPYPHLEANQNCKFQIIPFEEAKQSYVTYILIALGSNLQPRKNLAQATKQIAGWGELQYSAVFINPDYTASTPNPKPEYSNQCAVIKLSKPVHLDELIQRFKSIENDCDRQHQSQIRGLENKRNSYKKVSLDIDVLAIKEHDSHGEVTEPMWLAIDKRYPFRHHEWVGIDVLLLD